MLVLGINYGSGHDSSAALAVDGQVKYAIAEERLSRVKQDGRFPRLAIEACLAHVGATVKDVEAVFCGWQGAASILKHDARTFLSGSRPQTVGGAVRFFASSFIDARRNSG